MSLVCCRSCSWMSGASLTVPVRPKSMPSMTPRRLPATQLPLTVCRAGPKWKASVLREWRRTIWIAGPCRAGRASFLRTATCYSSNTREEGLTQKGGATSSGLQAAAGQPPNCPASQAPATAALPAGYRVCGLASKGAGMMQRCLLKRVLGEDCPILSPRRDHLTAHDSHFGEVGFDLHAAAASRLHR